MTYEVIHAKPRPSTIDKNHFFVVGVDNKKIRLECWRKGEFPAEMPGVLEKVIIGEKAPDIYKTAIDEKVVGSLEHSAYLGRELTKAEIAIEKGILYIQDKKLTL